LQHKAAETRDLSILEDEDQVDAVKRALAVEDAAIDTLKNLGFDVEIIREQYLAVAGDEKNGDQAPDPESGSRRCSIRGELDAAESAESLLPSQRLDAGDDDGKHGIVPALVGLLHGAHEPR
jgi:hypothetical protein